MLLKWSLRAEVYRLSS